MANGAKMYEQGYSPMKHSGFGIASFIISLVIGVTELFFVIIAGVLEVTTTGGIDEESAVVIILGLLMIGGLVVSLVGTGLGITGLVRKNRKKVFSILGLVFNGMIILGLITLMIIGRTIS